MEVALVPLTVTACGVTGQSGGKHVCVLATVLAAGLVAGKKRLGCHPDCRSLLDCHAKRRRSDNVAFHQCTPQFKRGDAGARGLQNIIMHWCSLSTATTALSSLPLAPPAFPLLLWIRTYASRAEMV